MRYYILSCLLIVAYLFGCSNQVDSTSEPTEPARFEMNIDLSDAPKDVVKLSGRLTHRSYDEIRFNFRIDGDSAKASVNDIPSGTWMLFVDAYNDNDFIIYSGSASVSILPGIINQVRLNLNPTTGELLIIVTWGKEDGPSPDKKIIGHYPLDGNLLDVSGHDHHGRLSGPEPTMDRFGNINAALYFDGLDDFGLIPHYRAFDFDVQKTSYSVSFWVKSGNPGRGRLISKWNEHLDTPYPFSFQMSEQRCLCCLYDSHESNSRILSEYGDIWDDKWHHLAFIVDSDNMRQLAYLDGDLIHSSEISTQYSTNNNSDIQLSNMPHYETNKYQGSMDDIYLFYYALSEKDILRLYKNVE